MVGRASSGASFRVLWKADSTLTFYRGLGTEMLKQLPEAPQLLKGDPLLPGPVVYCGTWLSESFFHLGR